MDRRIILIVGLLLAVVQGIEMNAKCSPGSLRRYELFECEVSIENHYENPFDTSEVLVQGIFSTESSKVTIDGFYFQDYSRSLEQGSEKLTPVGKPHWRVRYAPVVEGTFSYVVHVTDASGTNSTTSQDFTVSGIAPKQGFAVVAENSRYFALDTGESFFPIGENICWAEVNGTYAMEHWMNRMAAVGGTYTRIWLNPFTCFALETKDAGLGKIALDAAWRVDFVLSLAKQLGIRIMFTIDSFNSLRIADPFAMWDDNPYNQANGGPISTPHLFFTDSSAKQYYERRLQYIAARWAFSPFVFSWEFFNEVDLTDSYDTHAIAAWHTEMGSIVRSIDPNNHLRTTSMSTLLDLEVQGSKSLDYAQTHHYGLDDFAEGLREDCIKRRMAFPDMPHLHGEYGIADPTDASKWDPKGIFVHNGILPAMASGCAGSAMTWWWDNYIDPLNLYDVFSPAAELAAKVDWSAHSTWVDIILEYSRPFLRVFGLMGDTSDAVLWIQNTNSTWFLQKGSTPLVAIPETSITFYGLDEGIFEVVWYETSTPVKIVKSEEVSVSSKRQITLTSPVFNRDLVCIIQKS